MTISIAIQRDQNKTQICAGTTIILYLFLLPEFSMMALASSLIFDNPNMTEILGLPFVFLFFSVPLSVPITLYMVWREYSRGKYTMSCWLCLIPLFLIIATISYGRLLIDV